MSKIYPVGSDLGPTQAPGFFTKFNAKYLTEEAMIESRDALDKAGVDRTKMVYGEYQRALVPKAEWPGNSYDAWEPIVANVRKHLECQKNQESLDGTVPATRWDLLNAAIRKCFNNLPKPIRFRINPEVQPEGSSTENTHTIELVWEKSNPPRLIVRMICPYGSDVGNEQ